MSPHSFFCLSAAAVHRDKKRSPGRPRVSLKERLSLTAGQPNHRLKADVTTFFSSVYRRLQSTGTKNVHRVGRVSGGLLNPSGGARNRPRNKFVFRTM